MSKYIPLGRVAGVELRARPSALVALLSVWSFLLLIAVRLLKLKPATAVIGSLVATLLHFFHELWHQMGHARAADLTGYRMKGITFVGPLATSVYPSDEPALPPDIHIQRALGGPIFSALWSLVLTAVALLLKPVGGTAWYVALFALADNTLVFTLGSLLPLGFTDGSTLLEWWPKRTRTRVIID